MAEVKLFVRAYDVPPIPYDLYKALNPLNENLTREQYV